MQSFTPNVELLEEFVWGKHTDGKSNPLQDWEKLPGVQQYLKLLWKLHFKQAMNKEELELLDSWMSNRRYGEYLNVLLKYCLQQIDQEKNEEKRKKLFEEFNNQFLHFSFNHERDARGGLGSDVPTEVPTQSSKNAPKGRTKGDKGSEAPAGLKVALTTEEQQLMLTKTICKTIESDKSYYDWDLSSADQSFLKTLDLSNMESTQRIGVALETLQDFAFCKNIYSVLKRYKKMSRKDYKYFTIPEHYFKKMTLQQLEDMDSDGDASENNNFQTLRYVARHHADLTIISDAHADLADKRAALFNLMKVTDKKAIRLVAIEALLINGYEQGIYDFDILLKFLDDPTQHISHFSEKMCKRTYSNTYLGHQVLQYKQSIVSSINLDQIVHLHVKEYVKDEKSMKHLTYFFDKYFLTGLLIRNKALGGAGMTEFREFFGNHQAEQLENLKVLEFNKATKRVFKRKDPVEVFLNIKNIQSLKVKVFQLDTVHLYRTQSITAYEKLDLDGLIARDVLEFTFGYPKQQQFVHKVNFPDIQARDQCLFILEFVAGALNIRMVVRKGALQIFPTEHFQGIQYRILDEQKNICKGDGTGIFVDNRFYPTDTEGKVLFPFSTEPTNDKKVVVVHKGFAGQCSLTVPQELYSLRSTMIVHEEGLVCDQVNRLVFRNRLMLNNTPITLRKVTECFVTVETHNFQSLRGFREFKGLVLSDEQDLVIELPTPKLLSHLEVVLHLKFKDLRGNEVHLQENHRVSVDRNNMADTFCTVHLKSSLTDHPSKKSYMLQVLGKNGEGIADHRIRVQLIKAYGLYDFEHYLYTDKHGMASLGSIDHLKYITAECPNGLFKKRLFTIPNELESLDLPSVVEMIAGEKLVLPSLSRKLAREVFEFFKVGIHPYQTNTQIILSDSFDLLKLEADSIVASGLLPGEYIFRYNLYPCRKILVKVHQGVRWQSNPFILEKNRSLTELRPESRYLTVSKLTKTDQALSIGLQTNSERSTLRAHLLGYHFRPTLKERLSGKLHADSPVFTSRTTTIPRVENTQLEDRVLSDELAYVMERRTKPAMVGNTLDKPSILLHRDKVRETKDDEEVLKDGRGFSDDKFAKQQEVIQKVSDSMMLRGEELSKNLYTQHDRLELMDKSESLSRSSAFFKKESKSTGFWGGIKQAIGSLTSTKDSFDGVDYSQRPRLEIRNAQLPSEDIILNNMDYSKNSGMVLANIKPDSAGVVHLPLENLKGYGFYVLILCDLHSTLVIEFHENSGQILKRDMRPQEIMKPREILQVNYTVHASDPAHKVEITGVQSAQSAVIEDLESLREALLCLAAPDINKQELGEWTFLTKWASLTNEEKESKWDKYGGHELSVFTFLRDQPFFLNFIQPLLRSKVQQSFIDKILSAYDKNIDPRLDWTEIASFDKIATFSAVEILLLVLLSPKDAAELRKNILFYVESQVNSEAADNSQVKNIWESLLNRSTNPSEDSDDSVSSKSTNKKSAPVDSSVLRGSVVYKPPPKPAELDCLMDLGGEIAPSGKRAPPKELAQQVLTTSKQEMPLGDSAYDPGFVKVEEVDNPVILEEYHKAPLANEFRERQEHFVGEYCQIPFNKQWLKIYQHIAAKRNEGKPPSELLDPQTWVFVSEELLFMKNSTAEVVAALTIAPLAANKTKVTPVEVSSTSLKYRGSQPYFVLVKSSRIDSSSDPLELDIVVAQKFYDPQDKHIYDEKDPKIFTIKEISEFLTAKIYESRVSVSNLSESSATLDLHTQVPQGALAVYQLEDFSTSSKTIEPMQTKMYTFKFYFPTVGEYKVYPATVTQNNRFVTCAKLGKDSLLGQTEFKLKVVDDYRPENKPLQTLQDMISFGGADDILKLMSEKNLFNTNLFDLAKVRWVAKSSKQNFLRLVALLRKNFIFDQAIWAYSIHHGCHQEFLELMSVIAGTFASSCKYLDLGHNIVLDRFMPLEYDPLVNPRAHEIQQKGINIRNQAFRDTYTNFLVYCCEKVVLSPEDRVVFLAYLVLQDRISDAQEQLGKIKFDEIYARGRSTLQLDYLRAYLSMYKEAPEFPTAREMAKKYQHFPDLSWRERFVKIQTQLEEYDKGRVVPTVRDALTGVQVRSNKELAEKAEFLKIEKTSEEGVHVVYKNIDRLKVRFYKFDIELLYSMDPFGDSRAKGVESVQANHELKFRVIKADDFKTSIVPIPKELEGTTFIVQVNAIDKLDVIQVYRSTLSAHVDTEFGLVKVFDPQDKPLPACYVKCFSKGKTGAARFYKDGYTDFRGSFDYASLNSDGLGSIEEFSILVISPDHGSKILKAKPPGTIGRITKLGSPADILQSEEAADKFLSDYQSHLFKFDTSGELL